MPDHAIPAGFEPIFMVENFTTLIGPLYSKPDPEHPNLFRLGFRATEAHLNREGVIHGGMLATVADQAIGINMAFGSGQLNDVLTVSLSIEYISGALVGDWVESRPVVHKANGRTRFGGCQLYAGDRLLLTASAVFVARPLKT